MFGVEQYEGSVDYASVVYPKACAFVFGNEVGGVSLDALAVCDEVIEIPMCGEKESLNVSVAVGVVLFRALR